MALSHYSARKVRLESRRALREPLVAQDASWDATVKIGARSAAGNDEWAAAIPAIRLPLVTDHADWRAASRQFADDALALTIICGTVLHRAGAVFCSVRRKDALWDGSLNHHIEQLNGTTVVLDRSERFILTVYRSPNAHRRIKHKSRRSLKPRRLLAGR